MAETMKIVVMKKEGPERDGISAALEGVGFKVSFSGAIESTFELLAEIKPQVFLMYSDTLEQSQTVVFMQRLELKETNYLHFKVMIVPELSAPMYALSSDAGISKLISADTDDKSVALEIRGLYSNVDVISKIKTALNEVHSGSYSQEKIDESINALYAEHPNNEDLKLEYGHLLLRKDDVDEAELVAISLLNSKPQNVRAMNLLSRISFKKGDTQKALATLNDANSLSPDNPERLCELGDLFFDKGNYEKAKECYARAHEIDPENKDAIKGLGGSMIQLDEAGAAIEFFQNALSEDELASFFNNTGVSFVQKEEYDRGMRLYEVAMKTLKTDKYKPQILFNKALSFKKQGELEAALKEFKRAIKINPDFEKAKIHAAAVKKAIDSE